MIAKKMTMPNFLIIGAAKSGSTSLYYYLKEHPQIFMSPVKESGFFVYEKPGHKLKYANRRNRFYFIDTLSEYQALFAGVKDEIAIGEASVRYLPNALAPQRIFEHIPKAKLIALLRNPIDRAYSHYMMGLANGVTSERFDQFVAHVSNQDTLSERQRFIVEDGFYYRHLRRYYELFDSSHIRTYLFDDLQQDPKVVVKDIFHFLEVDENFQPKITIHYNIANSNRLIALLNMNFPFRQTFSRRLPLAVVRLAFKVAMLSRRSLTTELTPALRAQLIALYREDIFKLQDLIQKDLSNWLR